MGLDANRRRLLLRLCLRTTEALAASANALRDHGPFQLYRAPPVAPSPPLSALTDEAALAQFAPPSTALALIAQTRLSLAALQKLRRGVRRYTPPDEVRPPGVLQRHSLAWLLWLAFAVFAYIKVMVHGWLPPFLASREEIRHASAEIAATTVRFWRTHVTEPVTGIWHELNHGVEKTIDPSTVRETEKSLSKMVGEFIRDVHGENAPSSTRMAAAEFEAAMARAAAGSLEDVMNVYENQIRKPIGGLLGGELLRALLLQVVQLKLLMEQEVEAVDRLLIRNDFNLQLMATVPAFLIVSTLFWAIRHLWRRARVAKGRDPIEQLRAEMVEITLLLARAERPPGEARIRSTDFGEALTQFEASPMQLQEVGEPRPPCDGGPWDAWPLPQRPHLSSPSPQRPRPRPRPSPGGRAGLPRAALPRVSVQVAARLLAHRVHARRAAAPRQRPLRHLAARAGRQLAAPPPRQPERPRRPLVRVALSACWRRCLAGRFRAGFRII